MLVSKRSKFNNKKNLIENKLSDGRRESHFYELYFKKISSENEFLKNLQALSQGKFPGVKRITVKRQSRRRIVFHEFNKNEFENPEV